MNTSILAEELAPLQAQIERTKGQLGALEGELRTVEEELATFADEQQRFDALQQVCDALDRLTELEAGDLFWQGLPEDLETGHIPQLRGRIEGFSAATQGVRDRQTALRQQIDQRHEELFYLSEEVRDAYAREESRKEEFVVEREISPLPYRRMVMPWSMEDESEKRFRKSVCLALLLSVCFSYLIVLVKVPVPDRATAVVEIPERLAMLVKEPLPKADPILERPKEDKKPEPEAEPEEKPADTSTEKPAQEPVKKATAQSGKEPPKGGNSETQKARKKAEGTGVLAFKEAFSDLMEEAPAGNVGLQARVRKDASKATGSSGGGYAKARRSLVAIKGKGSGGIANAGVSRDLGSGGGRGGGSGSGGGNAGRIDGVQFARVSSAVAAVEEEARPLSGGPGPARTDEEIQIVFDRYKAALYRIYNMALRKNPTLRGKMLLRITIEPSGAISACSVESTDLDSPELVSKILARVRRFNFGPKEGVPRITIRYPIDFLPAA